MKTLKQLQKIYTDKVNEYLSNGGTINTSTMGGTQGEQARIDINDGNGNIYRVAMFDDYDGNKPCVEIQVVRFEDKNQTTLWYRYGDVVYSEKHYGIKYNALYASLEEYNVIDAIRRDRERNDGIYVSEDINDIRIYKVLVAQTKKRLGRKRVSIEDIESPRRIYDGKKYTYVWHYKERVLSIKR